MNYCVILNNVNMFIICVIQWCYFSRTTRREVWYEWAVSQPAPQPVHNPGGRSCAGLLLLLLLLLLLMLLLLMLLLLLLLLLLMLLLILILIMIIMMHIHIITIITIPVVAPGICSEFNILRECKRSVYVPHAHELCVSFVVFLICSISCISFLVYMFDTIGVFSLNQTIMF